MMISPAFRFALMYGPRWLLAGLVAVLAGSTMGAQLSSVRPATDPVPESRNPVEAFAREMEDKFAVKGYQPVDPLTKALHGYFASVFAELKAARLSHPHDVVEAMSVTRQKLAGETVRMVNEFVAAGYKRVDAEIYFDRLFPRLQRDVISLDSRDQMIAARNLPSEDSSVSYDLLQEAFRLHVQGDNAGALKRLDDAVRFMPPNALLVLELALEQQKFGQVHEARANFDRVSRIYPRMVNLYMAVGLIRSDAGDLYGAIEATSIAIYLDPQAAPAYSVRGVTKLLLGDFQGAIDDLAVQIAVGERADLERIHLARAEAHLNLGHFDLAQADLAASLRIEPDFSQAHYLSGTIHSQLRNHGAALAAFNRALAVSPDHAAATGARMWTRLELGQTDAAIADADRYVALRKGSGFSLMVRGILFELLDQPEVAEREYRAAIRELEANPNARQWCYANFHLDLLLRRRGRIQQEYLKDVVEWPDEWPKRIALFLAGRITGDSLVMAGGQAARYRDRVNQVCEAQYYWGMALWAEGRREEAVARLTAAADPAGAGNHEYALARKFLRDGVAVRE